MKLPLVSRKKFDKVYDRLKMVIEDSNQHKRDNQVLATKLKRIQELCEDHPKKMGNLRFVTNVKEVMDK